MAKANINILDLNQKIMENYFVMTMAVDTAKATVDMAAIKKTARQNRQRNETYNHYSGPEYL